MAYRNRYRLSNRPLLVGDALAYGREDMNRVFREILITENIHIPSPLHR